MRFDQLRHLIRKAENIGDMMTGHDDKVPKAENGKG